MSILGSVTGKTTQSSLDSLLIKGKVNDRYTKAASVGLVLSYLLRQNFTFGDETFADGNTITGPGGGGTFESTDPDDTGVATIKGPNCVTQSGVLISNPGVSDTGIVGPAFTGPMVAGTVIKGRFRALATTVGRWYNLSFSPSGTDPNTATATGNTRVGVQAGGAGAMYVVTNDDDVNDYAITISPLPAGTPFDFELALVLGGWNSSGTPDVAGTYGITPFYKMPNGVWTRMPTLRTSKNYSGYIYPWWYFQSGWGSLNEAELPDPATKKVDAVFTPTGYALDTFTDTNGTALTSHIGESGETWIAQNGSFSIQSSGIQGSGIGTHATFEKSGISDFFGQCKILQSSTGFLFRDSGSGVASNWMIWMTSVAAQTLYEVTAGPTYTIRGSSTINTATPLFSVRASGTTIEVWTNGQGKISYTSSTWQTADNFGVRTDNSSNPCADWIHILPITSTTYDTELESF